MSIVAHHLFALIGDMAGHGRECLHPAVLRRDHSRASNKRVFRPSLD